MLGRHAAYERAMHSTHACADAHVSGYVYANNLRVLSTSVAFSEKLFGGFAAGLRRSVFLSRQWRNFHYNGAVIVLVVRRSSGGLYAECQFRVRANIRHEVLGLRKARRTRNW